MIGRASTILRIMGIEKEKRALIHNAHFKRLQENTRALTQATMCGTVGIYDPFNLDVYIKIKRNSEDIQEYQDKNKQGIDEFQKRISELTQEKMRLQQKIF